MANVFTTQTLEDGARNVVVLLTGVLDTSNEAVTLKVDVSALGGSPTRISVKRLDFAVSGALKVLLAWDATTDVTFAALSGYGHMKFDPPVINNAGAGLTGDIMLSTAGYATGTETYTVKIHGIKTRFS